MLNRKVFFPEKGQYGKIIEVDKNRIRPEVKVKLDSGEIIKVFIDALVLLSSIQADFMDFKNGLVAIWKAIAGIFRK